MSSHGIPHPQVPPHVAQITGPLLLGYFFNWLLAGALSVQAYVYYLGFPDDPLSQKGSVTVLYTLEILQLVLCTKDAFAEFGTGFGDADRLNSVGLLWFSVPVLSALIALIVQSFYAWKIWSSSKRIWVSAVIAVLSLAQCAAGIYDGVLSVHVGDLDELAKRHRSSTILRGAAAIACDVMIVISMFRQKSKPRPPARGPDRIISEISEAVIESGLLCTIFAALELGLFLGFRGTTYYYAPGLSLSKLYSNSLLALLNSRIPFSSLNFAEGRTRASVSTRMSFAEQSRM
ncbi:hypothetical protein BXZ70DRAFT_962254 [Cristinia sonorae]|uniref:DUF6534 domain-containing protein n=1 Tax=Cristinia sonorae TaxID=1940300 RepID=A0A8K0XKD1_9AGAR|nr:hypothetical protein BXZ70DRAFT_962254 [Cristinia sonorae]